MFTSTALALSSALSISLAAPAQGQSVSVDAAVARICIPYMMGRFHFNDAEARGSSLGLEYRETSSDGIRGAILRSGDGATRIYLEYGSTLCEIDGRLQRPALTQVLTSRFAAQGGWSRFGSEGAYNWEAVRPDPSYPGASVTITASIEENFSTTPAVVFSVQDDEDSW